MFAAELNRRVIIQQASTTKNALNESIGGWTNVTPGDGKVWAKIVDMTARQFIEAGATQNQIVTKITLRKRAGIVPAMRVLHGDIVYDITGVLERHDHFMDLMCARGVGNG